ncbi:hypothetical protein QYF61_023531 [Mycteria americana]|uniref:Uncharacterized protein n=1 Tax=Mycteria americana TaxID=33587 RepID=A0AAN7NWK3_MYCAM|nr:hypothetical protein QYF61_023531 [Mycteria americana]
MWVQSVVAGSLRDGDNSILPTEIQKIVWDAATEKERQLQAWWRLINFTHDQVLNAVIAHVLTMAEAHIEKVYPIMGLGVNTNRSMAHPLDHRMWVRVSDGKWQSVDFEACTLERRLGFICEDDALKASDVCFDTKEGVCHFEINPQSSNKTVLAYIRKGHLLIRNYTLYRSITLISIGMDLSLVKEMLEHVTLKQLLENAKAEAKKILITVHHNGNVIKQVENLAVKVHHVDAHIPKSRATEEHQNNQQVNQAAKIEAVQVDVIWQCKGELFIVQWAHDASGHQGRDATYRWAHDQGVDLTMDTVAQVIH